MKHYRPNESVQDAAKVFCDAVIAQHGRTEPQFILGVIKHKDGVSFIGMSAQGEPIEADFPDIALAAITFAQGIEKIVLGK